MHQYILASIRIDKNKKTRDKKKKNEKYSPGDSEETVCPAAFLYVNQDQYTDRNN